MSRILIADDDAPFRKILRVAVEALGHECVEVENGREALAAYDPAMFQLVITDIVMPQKDGLESIHELKRRNPRVKIIAMSGGGRMSADGYLKMAQQLGASAVLAKPFSRDELEATLEMILR